MDPSVRTNPPTLRWWHDRVLLGCTALALVPFVVATVALATSHAGHLGYGDNAVIELTVRELPRHPPLVGQVSRLVLRSPGPAMFYLLAPFYFLSGQRAIGLHIGVAVFDAAMILAIVALAHRRGGRGLALGMLAATAVTVHTLGVRHLADPWNPHLALLPLVVGALAAWAWADGDDRGAPWFVTVASFSVQAHTAVAVAFALLAVAAVGVRRANGHPWWPSAAGPMRTRTAVLLGALWALPLLDVVLHPPGNLARLAKFFATSHDHVTTFADGVRTARFPLGAWPSFASGDPGPRPQSTLADLAGAPVPVGLALLVVGAVLALRRRDRHGLRAPVALATALVVAVVIAVWRLIGELYAYVVLWVIPASAIIWVCLLWVLWRTVPVTVARRVAPALAGVLVALVAGVTVPSAIAFADEPADHHQRARVDDAVRVLEARLDRDRRVAVVLPDPRRDAAVELAQALVLRLVAEGFDVITPGLGKWWPRRDVEATLADQVVFVSTDPPLDLAPEPVFDSAGVQIRLGR